MFNARFEARAPLREEGFAERLRVYRTAFVTVGFMPVGGLQSGFRVMRSSVWPLAPRSINIANELQASVEAGEVVFQVDCSVQRKRVFLFVVAFVVVTVVGTFVLSMATGNLVAALKPIVSMSPAFALFHLFLLKHQLGFVERQANTIVKELAG